MKSFRIANVGTFDVENYGDLLFPNMLGLELSKRISIDKFSLFSPSGGVKPFEPDVYVHPLASFEENFIKNKYDAVIFGGGDLIRLDQNIAKQYTVSNINATNLLWLFSEVGKKHNIPIIWNSVGVPFDFKTEEEQQKIQKYCKNVTYLAVRDEISKNKLIKAGVKQNITVAPDSLIDLSKLFEKDKLHNRFKQLVSEGLLNSKKKFLVFQATPGFFPNQSDIKLLANSLKNIKLNYGLDIVLLPICYCHNDLGLLKNIKSQFPEDFFLVTNKLNPMDIASIISSSNFFIGTSLHGNITAFSYGINHLALNTANLSKINGFFELIDREDKCLKSIKDLEKIFNETEKNNEDKNIFNKKKNTLIKQLDKHFDHIVNTIINN